MEDFVPFKLAKKLKEKGFNKRVRGYYWEIRGLSTCNTPINSNALENEFSAPTISQVLKWLREEKGYHIEFIGNACGYLFIVSDIPSKGGTDRHCSDYDGPNDGGCWDSYEEAAIAGIEYVLDNLI